MIIARLVGGLGNQLFQYAAGRRLAEKTGGRLMLDVSWFSEIPPGDTLRSYSLDAFCIEAAFASKKDVARFSGSLGERILGRFPRLAKTDFVYRRRLKVVERKSQFDPVILSLPNQRYLVGYWQSEKYFADIEPVLRRELCFRDLPDGAAARLAERIGRCEAVSVHVRRGDYVSSLKTAKFHGVCSIDYYRQAMETMVERIPGAHFFVFSDDPGWARANLWTPTCVTSVEPAGPGRDYDHLHLMSLCKHHIIANSSFSWWGAWLSNNPGKSVIAPRQWFGDSTMITDDLLPEAWERL